MNLLRFLLSIFPLWWAALAVYIASAILHNSRQPHSPIWYLMEAITDWWLSDHEGTRI